MRSVVSKYHAATMSASITRVTDFPHKVRVVPHKWITMSDGARLAAKLWLPEGTEDHPVPAILEYIPYRKNDFTAVHDHAMHAYFAGHGYASVRVDLRGSGDSDGILSDEYLPLEQSDGVEVIASLAEESFCSGKVGMIGISWGGFNGLQIAAHGPPGLGAVVSVCSTDDRYSDDVHYIGGALHGEEMLGWASVMLGYNARPPDPEVVGDAWRATWIERMEKTPPFIDAWMRHQRRDEFWTQGSVCEDYAAIKCPVYMVGGWQDGYRNAILRYLEGYDGPAEARGIIGPWGHTYPNFGSPGPAIGFLQECLRFYDCYLKGEANGFSDEPKLRVFLPDAMRPTPASTERTGVWLAEPAWPSPNVTVVGCRPTLAGGLLVASDPLEGSSPAPEAPRADEAGTRLVPMTQAVGFEAGPWCGYGGPLDNPSDQRAEDARSLVFDSRPLNEELPILGRPAVTLELESDQPAAQVAVRLCDVWPDGASTLITRGVLNLTHRHDDEHPLPLEAGRRCTAVVELAAIAYRLPPGHRMRMAVSSAYFPLMWPPPVPVQLIVHVGPGTELRLPLRHLKGGGDAVPRHFGQPEAAPDLPHEELLSRGGESVNRLSRDAGSGAYELVVGTRDRHVRIADSGLEYAEQGRSTYRVIDGDPLSASARSEQRHVIGRGNWRTTVETRSTLTASAEEFVLSNELDAFEGDERVFSKVWRARIPREQT
jgi:putative CocE/NonD family hydrolase